MKNRIQYDDAGNLDEVVTDGGAHLEALDDNHWFLCCERADGTALCLWIEGRILDTEERDAGGFRLFQDRVKAIADDAISVDSMISALHLAVDKQTQRREQ